MMIDSVKELNHRGDQRQSLGHWLNCRSRCFGDKGDVEDITEG